MAANVRKIPKHFFIESLQSKGSIVTTNILTLKENELILYFITHLLSGSRPLLKKLLKVY